MLIFLSLHWLSYFLWPVAPEALVAPEVDQPLQEDGGGPLIPELPNHLIPVEARMRELGHRLSINSIGKNLTPRNGTAS